MAFCKNCGSALPEKANNCPNCGASVDPISDAVNNAANAIGEQYKKIEGADTTANYDKNELREHKAIFALSYLWFLFFLPLVVCPDSKAGKFHANQGFLTFLSGALISVVCTIIGACFSIIPFGYVITTIVSTVLGVANLILVIIGIVNALNERIVELPIVGKIRIIK